MKATFQQKFFAAVDSSCYLVIFMAGMVLEWSTLQPLFSTMNPERLDFWDLMLGHSAANIVMAGALARVLPPKYRAHWVKSFSYYFLCGFFIPILADLGLLVVYFLGIRQEKKTGPGTTTWRVTGQALMPNRAPVIHARPKFGDHGMESRLRKSANLNDHLGIVLATRFMRDENAVPLLNVALRSQEDDVRLLAFSLLEKKTADINSRIAQLQHSLTIEDNKTKIHVAIANNYLHLVRLELIQEEMKTQALNKARHHLHEALSEDPSDRSGHFILGQVLLEQGEVNQAQATLAKALELGFAPSDVYPFLAKAAYMRRQFRSIPEYIMKIPAEHRMYPPLANISAYWLRS